METCPVAYNIAHRIYSGMQGHHQEERETPVTGNQLVTGCKSAGS